MKQAVVTGNTVENVIVADESFSSSEGELVPVDGAAVSPGDIRAGGEFRQRGFVIDAPDTIPNDGTAATVTVTVNDPDTHSVTVAVEGTTETFEATPLQTTHEVSVSSTAAAGTTFEVAADALGLDRRTETIEVVAA